MKLDRNDNTDGRGKYALLLLRRLELFETGEAFQKYTPEIAHAIETLDKEGLIDWGIVGSESEFFLTRLKDKNAAQSLRAYADAAETEDPEWAAEVREMAVRADKSPWKKRPD